MMPGFASTAAAVTGPQVAYEAPLGEITIGNPVISAQAIAGSSTSLTAYVRLARQDLVNPWEFDIYAFDCTVDGAGAVSCPTAGLPIGLYTATVSVVDGNSMMADATRNFTITCSGVAPTLSLTKTGAYWASYADYVAGNLNVDFRISNISGIDAGNVSIVGTMNTNGVVNLAPLPPPANIPAGTHAAFTVLFSVPEGVTLFRSTVYATAQDPCGNAFSYPGAWPGA
ncbi:MAG: hypothetical protein M1539_03830 [Actinobacteria bacterium]|nr:hypothetical protein [Actinomycetota bacterium]MCL5883088.1 hypothetical protein [Actinomycetota bacterium]